MAKPDQDKKYYAGFVQGKWQVAGASANAEEVAEDLERKILETSHAKRSLLGNARDLMDYARHGNLSKKDLALVLGALIYFISPVDLIPDIIPIAGLIDDAAIVAIVFGKLSTRIAAFKKDRNG
jgi:uncharacterized membrane protein YkvA (DUF1232 family)